MATSKKKDKNVTVSPSNGEAKGSEVLQQLFISTIDRRPKDPGKWRSALIAAERVHSPNRAALYDLYEDLLLDPVLTGLIRKRISQVVNKKLLFRIGEEENDVMKKLCTSKALKDLQRQFIWQKMWGLNGFEFVPGPSLAFNLIPKKHIKPEKRIIAYNQYDNERGMPYDNMPNIWILGDGEKDLGLLVICGFVSLLKKGAVSDWAQYIEIFGSPAIVLKYKGYDTQAKKAADKILQNIGNSMRMSIPEEMNLTFEDGKMANGDGKLHATFVQVCDEQVSIAILGNTETTGHSKTGTGAKSETHAKQQLEIIRDDMDDIVDLLNSDKFMDILRSYGYPVEGGRFEFDSEVDMDMIGKKKDIDLAFIQAGLQVGTKYIYDTYAIPQPKPGDDLFVVARNDNPPEEETETKPKRGRKPVKPEALSAGDVMAMMDEKLKAFFGPAL